MLIARQVISPHEVGQGLGVYVHVPFCSRRCDYCAFVTYTGREHQMDAYVEAVVAEVARARRDGLLGAPATVYFGGGTPSLLGGPRLACLLEAVGADEAEEVTVECNPESTDLRLLEELKKSGVSRVSLGVQSLIPGVLAGLGRDHDPDEARRAIAAVGDVGFSSFNVDLIYGGAGEQDRDWEATLQAVLSLEPTPPHVSAYALSVEPGTPLALDPSRHPDDDEQADRYLLADRRLSRAGLEWYEISNFARPGHECRHNRSCWAQGNYLGFGPAAHSHLDGRRFRNVASLDRYLARVAAGEPVVATCEVLDAEERALEALQLALRTREGVARGALASTEGIEDLVFEVGGRFVLTPRGRLLANEVTLRLQTEGPPAAVQGAPIRSPSHGKW